MEPKHLRKHRRYRPSTITLVVFLCSFALSVYINHHAGNQAIERQRFDLFRELSTFKATLEGLIRENMVVASGIGAELSLYPDLDKEKFALLARQLIANREHIRHIALAPGLIVSAVYPEAGNESAIGLDYKTVPAQYDAVMRVVNRKSPVLAGPVELVQGGQALIARVPVFNGFDRDDLWGVIATVMNIEPLFADAGIAQLQSKYDFALRGTDGHGADGAVFIGKEKLFSNNAVIIDIKIPGGSWQAAVIPKDGWQAPWLQHAVILSIGAAFSFVLSVAVNLFMRVQRERAISIRRLERQASVDQLTGLANRYLFNRQLAQLIEDAKREESQFSLLFIDIDNFKEINDSLGHHIGDELLTHVAKRLRGTVRAVDLTARLGGDEFVIVFKNIGEPSRAELMAKKSIQALIQPYSLRPHTLNITVSIGIAIFPVDGITNTILLQHADTAMYSAKSAGRDAIRFFNIEMRNEADRYVDIHNDILTGINENQFKVYYQPIYDLKARCFNKCEALIRWQHPEKGFIPPNDFIPIAEQTGSIRAVGFWVLEQVVKDYNRLRNAGFDMEIAINKSRNEFRDVESTERWIEIINEHKIPFEKIVIEITESLLMDGNRKQIEALNGLKAKGMKVAIDDFGTGYSAMNYLRRFPVNYLKIDKSFIDGICQSPLDSTLVTIIIQMAKALDIKVIAEGIERQEQFDALAEQDCEFIQGFLLAKPMPMEQLLDFIKQQPH